MDPIDDFKPTGDDGDLCPACDQEPCACPAIVFSPEPYFDPFDPDILDDEYDPTYDIG